MGNAQQGDTRRRAHGCTHRTHGVDFETRDAVSMRRRGQPNDAGVAWVVATPGPKRFSTSKQSPIRQRHQQLKVPMPSDVRALIERKHTTITAVRGDPRRIGRVLGTPVPTERPATAPAGRRPYEAPRSRPRSARPWTTQGGRARIDGKHTTVTAVRYQPRYKPPPIYCRGREVTRDDATYHTAKERLNRSYSRPQTAPVRRRNGGVDHVRTHAQTPLFDIPNTKRPRPRQKLTKEERRFMLANGWPAAGPKDAAVTHWGGDHASRVLPFAAGCGFEAYPDDDVVGVGRIDSGAAQPPQRRAADAPERLRRCYHAGQGRLPRSTTKAPVPDRREVASEERTPQEGLRDLRPRAARRLRPPNRWLLATSPAEQRRLRRDHALEYPARVDLPPPAARPAGSRLLAARLTGRGVLYAPIKQPDDDESSRSQTGRSIAKNSFAGCVVLRFINL